MDKVARHCVVNNVVMYNGLLAREEANLRKLHTKREQREFDRGGALVTGFDWLNERTSKARSRVVRLLELLQTADLLSKKLREANASLSRNPFHRTESDRLFSTLSAVDEILGLYRGTRMLWVTEQYELEEMFALDPRKLERDDNYYVETAVINYVLQLLRSGSIQRLRTCRECEKWFYAMTDHQRHCSDNCRQRFASHDQVFKERRREYMKKYRKKEHEQDRRLRQMSRIAK